MDSQVAIPVVSGTPARVGAPHVIAAVAARPTGAGAISHGSTGPETTMTVVGVIVVFTGLLGPLILRWQIRRWLDGRKKRRRRLRVAAAANWDPESRLSRMFGPRR